MIKLQEFDEGVVDDSGDPVRQAAAVVDGSGSDGSSSRTRVGSPVAVAVAMAMAVAVVGGGSSRRTRVDGLVQSDSGGGRWAVAFGSGDDGGGRRRSGSGDCGRCGSAPVAGQVAGQPVGAGGQIVYKFFLKKN
ncbi:hypothetical protein Q3G72_011522 [Acer saccharum]|nr:hypothetical protein Q3G72_011522 [Acer saccharum]